jgi:HSP20 family protein
MANQDVTTRDNSGNGKVANTGENKNDRKGERNDQALLPQVDVIEDTNGITLYADMPGVPKENLNIRVDGETLMLEAELSLSLPGEMEASHAEVQRTAYRRAFTLSRELDPEKISAEFSQGVLRLSIPKAAHAQPRRITVQSA